MDELEKLNRIAHLEQQVAILEGERDDAIAMVYQAETPDPDNYDRPLAIARLKYINRLVKQTIKQFGRK